ncbi:HAD family hydrolase [Desertihabitans brevis]|uniref:HAD family hydrolase n=1 Tax=Desertihabitans brevis TaxID=2268447 RepID=A0A367YS40_9ACTN|nr:HAD family hydrolase [Desertihabitans brevis]RCK68654.1 HAD family hydrolase [Desertihabitans brevis]
MSFSSIIFDWRGTLVTTLSWSKWIEHALHITGRDSSAPDVQRVEDALAAVDPGEARLDAPGVDCDADLHRTIYFEVFSDAGLDRSLAEALYAVESDYRYNPFATDVAETFKKLKDRGKRIAVLSDLHFDLRPAFFEAGLGTMVDAFVLSFEQGVQKPNPAIFEATLNFLSAEKETTLMVGDRSKPDGAAVELGITTLLLPPLRSVEDRRLHRVTTLCGLR